jgi:phosphatidylserine/phosphatidylglycerophosphate/cardiolipin synthase-like enzyme
MTGILKFIQDMRRFARKNFASIIFAALASIILIFCAYILTTKYARSEFNSQFQIIYSLDKRQNDQEIIRLIDDAHRYVYFAMYTFTLSDVADALIRARERGVMVAGITDAGQATTSEEAFILQKLRAAGIGVLTQKHLDGIMHVKALVTDQAYASGSYNWTESATEANDEILEIGTDPNLRDRYLAIVRKILTANQ